VKEKIKERKLKKGKRKKKKAKKKKKKKKKKKGKKLNTSRNRTRDLELLYRQLYLEMNSTIVKYPACQIPVLKVIFRDFRPFSTMRKTIGLCMYHSLLTVLHI